MDTEQATIDTLFAEPTKGRSNHYPLNWKHRQKVVPFTKTEKTKNVRAIFHISVFEVGNLDVGNQICLAIKRWRGYLATQLGMSNKWLNLRSQSWSKSEIDILKFITISVQWSFKVGKKIQGGLQDVSTGTVT